MMVSDDDNDHDDDDDHHDHHQHDGDRDGEVWFLQMQNGIISFHPGNPPCCNEAIIFIFKLANTDFVRIEKLILHYKTLCIDYYIFDLFWDNMGLFSGIFHY